MPRPKNNTGGRSGKRKAGGGRKKKILENGEMSPNILKMPDLQTSETMPDHRKFLQTGQMDGYPELEADQVFQDTWDLLKRVGCAENVPKDLIERYAMCYARWIQCENINSENGFMSKHPTTGNPMRSPFVDIGINYLNQAGRIWDEIVRIMKENGTKNFEEVNPQDEMMERILQFRKA